jgi:predicted ArsR family transcriptional regulator
MDLATDGPKEERRIPVELTTKQKVEILYFDESKTVREIAETLGITTQAVYLHLKDLRERREVQAS